MATPEHIAPVWYFTPFYAILRAVPNKLWGAVLMGGLRTGARILLPWLDRSRVKSIRYRGWIYKLALSLFRRQLSSLLAGLGIQPAEGIYVLMAQHVLGHLFPGFFLLMPYYSAIDKTKPVPDRVVYHG